MEIIDRPSPNFNDRRGAGRPDMVLIHYTVLGCEASLDRLCAPEHEVSAHYVISEQGRIWRLVDEDLRAWHAGKSHWQGEDDINSLSIGIELVNDGAQPFPEPQMTALEALLADVTTRRDIAPARVLGHEDVAPGRKHDPGPRFDWGRLVLRGMAQRPQSEKG